MLAATIAACGAAKRTAPRMWAATRPRAASNTRASSDSRTSHGSEAASISNRFMKLQAINKSLSFCEKIGKS